MQLTKVDLPTPEEPSRATVRPGPRNAVSAAIPGAERVLAVTMGTPGAAKAVSARRAGRSWQMSADRKSTRLNSSHTEIYTLSLHDALPICRNTGGRARAGGDDGDTRRRQSGLRQAGWKVLADVGRSEEHTSELQSHRDLHSFPTRRSSDLPQYRGPSACWR